MALARKKYFRRLTMFSWFKKVWEWGPQEEPEIITISTGTVTRIALCRLCSRYTLTENDVPCVICLECLEFLFCGPHTKRRKK